MSVNNFQTPKCFSNTNIYGDKKFQTNPTSTTYSALQNTPNGQNFASHNVQCYENQQFLQQQVVPMKSPAKQPFSSQQIHSQEKNFLQNLNTSQINSPSQNSSSQQYIFQNQSFQQNAQQPFNINQHAFPINQNFNFSYQTNSNINTPFSSFNNQIMNNQFQLKQPTKSFPSLHQQPQPKNGPVEQKELKQGSIPSYQQPFYFGNANQKDNFHNAKYQQNIQSPIQPNIQDIQQPHQLSNQNVLTSQTDAQKVIQPFMGSYPQQNKVSNNQQNFNNKLTSQNISANQKNFMNINRNFENIKLTDTSQENINTSHNIQSTPLGNVQLNVNNCAFNFANNPTPTALGTTPNVPTSTFQSTLPSTTNNQIISTQAAQNPSQMTKKEQALDQKLVDKETQPATSAQVPKQEAPSTSSSSIMTSSSELPHDSFGMVLMIFQLIFMDNLATHLVKSLFNKVFLCNGLHI